jgi:FAD/FMN-containing dehydrogenase
MTAESIPGSLLEVLSTRLGSAGFLTEADVIAPYFRDERKLYEGSSPAVLRPASTDDVAFIVRSCAAANVALVPQGGNTGYVGGAVPGLNGPALLLSLSRMNQVRDIDVVDYSMIVEAGCVLADLQAVAADNDRLLPLSLAAQGSCQIGGNLSTNAGGVQVLRYGNARDLVLGLEVVMPDGNIWNGLKRLRKDNTGYDLKQLFLGAEGTLGIITAAALKLFPAARDAKTFLAAIKSPEAATSLLARLRGSSADSVTSFEYFHRDCMALVLEHIAGVRDPFDAPYEHYVLVQLSSGQAGDTLNGIIEGALAESFELGETLDAVVATSEEQSAQLWRLRETIPEAQKHAGGCIKHDVSVQVSHVPEFLSRARQIAHEHIPGVRVAPFGHIGDGNVHFNLTQPRDSTPENFLGFSDSVTREVHDLVHDMGGSFSAEHGVGRLKRDDLARYRDPLDLELMRRIKTALDPQGLMNPGVVL